jgi:hypothetical protein
MHYGIRAETEDICDMVLDLSNAQKVPCKSPYGDPAGPCCVVLERMTSILPENACGLRGKKYVR